MLNLSYVIKLF